MIKQPDNRKPAEELSDEELLDEIREQVNKSRFGGGHQPERTREIAREANRRWQMFT